MTAAETLRRHATDPVEVLAALGLGVDPRDREGRLVRCPEHGGVSLSVTRGNDGTVRVRCFGCDLSGDLYHLVGAVERLDIRTQFPAVFRAAAKALGRLDLLDDVDGRPRTPRPSPPASPVAPSRARTYPAAHELAALRAHCTSVADDAPIASMLTGRGIDVETVDDLGLAWALPVTAALPWWARSAGGPWTATDHRLILPVVDAHGVMRSVRAWQIDGRAPKRLPPANRKAAGLVLACPMAVALLSGMRDGWQSPLVVVVTEGEPDFLARASRPSDADETPPVVLGIGSGWWTQAHADRIPDGATVVLATDHDDAGHAYAAHVATTIGTRCRVLRTPQVVA